jgi:hypothetical protein
LPSLGDKQIVYEAPLPRYSSSASPSVRASVVDPNKDFSMDLPDEVVAKIVADAGAGGTDGVEPQPRTPSPLLHPYPYSHSHPSLSPSPGRKLRQQKPAYTPSQLLKAKLLTCHQQKFINRNVSKDKKNAGGIWGSFGALGAELAELEEERMWSQAADEYADAAAGGGGAGHGGWMKVKKKCDKKGKKSKKKGISPGLH